MQIKNLDQNGFEQWNDFVFSSDSATFFHRAEWKTVIEKSFGHTTYYFFVEDQGKIIGILPLVHIKSLLFGNSLSSCAFCVYGGIIAKNEQAYKLLDDKACELAKELKVDHVEMRNRVQLTPERPYKKLYVTFRKELADNDDANMQQIPRKQRAMVRKGIKAGLQSGVDSDVERFYAAYSESVRNLGTPVFPKKYFHILMETFQQDCEVLTIVNSENQLVASVMSFFFKDEVLPYYGGGTSLARSVQGNDFMYWEVMRRATEKGIRVFDYGRSKEGTGSYKFKRHWGFEPEPLFYEFHLVESDELPDINPLNPKYQMFIAAWKKLPLPVSQIVGPILAKDLG